MTEMTFQQLDALERDRAAKRRECVERLSKILAKEFSADELRFIWNAGGPSVSSILIESFEIARGRG